MHILFVVLVFFLLIFYFKSVLAQSCHGNRMSDLHFAGMTKTRTITKFVTDIDTKIRSHSLERRGRSQHFPTLWLHKPKKEMCPYFKTYFAGIRRHWILVQFHMASAELASTVALGQCVYLRFSSVLVLQFFWTNSKSRQLSSLIEDFNYPFPIAFAFKVKKSNWGFLL